MVMHPVEMGPFSPAASEERELLEHGDVPTRDESPNEAAAALRKAAEVVYGFILEKQPADYRTLMSLGYLARQRGDAAAALDYFATARGVNPVRTRPQLEMAVELRTLSRLDEAEDLYRGLMERHPNLVRALAGLGQIEQLRGRPRQALRYYQAAAAADPARADLKLRAAAQLRRLSRFREAEQVYRDILADRPGHAVARRRLERLPRSTASGLPPMESGWLRRETFLRAAEWGGHLESLGRPALGMSVLALAQDFAAGASEEVKSDCILLRLGGRTKLLPLVSSLEDYAGLLTRETKALRPGDLLGYVPARPERVWTNGAALVRTHREVAWRRENLTRMPGASLQACRRSIRALQEAGAQMEPVGPGNLARVVACEERWHAAPTGERPPASQRARTAWIFENLPLLEALGMKHVAVVMDGDVVGYAVGSPLGTSWAACVCAAHDRLDGIVPLLVREHAKLYPDREWVSAGRLGRRHGLAAVAQELPAKVLDKRTKAGWIQA